MIGNSPFMPLADPYSSEACHAAILDAALDAVVVMDHQGCVLEFNRAAEAMFGYSRDQVLGKAMAPLIIPRRFHERHVNGLAHYVETGAGLLVNRRIETIAVRADGSEFPVELAITAVSHHDGSEVSKDVRRTPSLTPVFIGFLRDISERRGAEAAQQESEARLRFALGAANMVAWDWDPRRGEIVRSENSLDLPMKATSTPERFYGLIHPDDRLKVEMAIKRALDGRGTYDEEFRLLTGGRQGNPRWVRDRAQVTFDVDGRPMRMAGICVDITEHKQTVAALHAGEKRFRAMIEKSWDGVALLAADGRVQYASPAISRILGYTPDETAAPNITETIHPEDQSRITTLLSQLLSSPGGSATCEYRTQHRDGTWRWVEGTCTNLLADDSVQAIVANFRDVTERKRLEEERDRLFAVSDDLMSISGFDGYFKRVNPAFEKTLGHSPAELLAHPISYFIHPEDQAATRGERENLLAGSMTSHFQNRYRCRDGSYKWLSWSAVPVVSDGLIYAVARDITEQKRAEQQLREFATQLERSNRELQEFAYVASHDLQEPLRKIEAFGGRIKASCGPVLGQEGSDYLDRMQKAASRMRTLINDLLAFSRVTTKARPFVLVDLAAVAQEVLSDLEARIEQTGGAVDLGDLPTLHADPTQMRQLLQNLIGNALKFHREGQSPTVRVRSSPVTPDSRSRRGEEHPLLGAQPPSLRSSPASNRGENSPLAPSFYRISVQDDGIGFDDKYIDRIFNPFQRLHGRGEYEGTGIGLAICRKIAERHRGSITASSTPEQGSTFVVTLPARQPKGDVTDD